MNQLPHPFAFPLHPPTLAGQARRLGDYELLEELATGRSFRVDLALASNGACVALKRARGESPQARARLQREAGVCIDAPNLLRNYGLLQEPEPALALEFVQGVTLRQLLANAQPGDLRHALTAWIGALHGLAALHGYRDGGYLVHQAPVARHVLVGVDGVARLIDLSHLRGNVLPDIHGLDQGLVLSELAPEQIQKRAALDPRSDVFIAGATLRELIARCRVTQRTPLDDVWRRATATRPQERYWSAHELAFATGRAMLRAGLSSSPDELASWVRSRMHDDRPSGVRPPPPLPRHAAPAEPWVELADDSGPVYDLNDLHDERSCVSFVPPRVSLPQVAPTQERMSSVWYSVVAKPSDDDVVKAIAAAQPLRARPPRRLDLRSVGSGVTLGCLGLCALIAMGASPHEDRASLRASPVPQVAAAQVTAAPRRVVPQPPPPVPAVTSLQPAARAPATLSDEPRERSERRGRREQVRRQRGASVAQHAPQRELIRMTGSVPANPY